MRRGKGTGERTRLYKGVITRVHLHLLPMGATLASLASADVAFPCSQIAPPPCFVPIFFFSL